MRKKVFVMISILLLFTQCKKEDDNYTFDDMMVPVRLEVPINQSSRSVFANLFPNGEIKWGNDAKMEYVYIAAPNTLYYGTSGGVKLLGELFEMKASVENATDKLIFEGNVLYGVLKYDNKYDVYYFGNNGNAPENSNVTDISKLSKHISGKRMTFDKQTGDINKLGDYQLAKAYVTVSEIVRQNDVIALYKLEMSDFNSVTSLAMLDLEGETRLKGSAAKLTSFSVEWTDDYVFVEKFGYDTLEYIDVSGNVGEKSLISLLPTEEQVTLECGKGKYVFKDGIKSNQVYLSKAGKDIDEALPLKWENP